MKSINELSYRSITTLAFYNYPTTVITTNLTHYGSYKTVEPFDPPTQNTINKINAQTIKLILYRLCKNNKIALLPLKEMLKLQ